MLILNWRVLALLSALFVLTPAFHEWPMGSSTVCVQHNGGLPGTNCIAKRRTPHSVSPHLGFLHLSSISSAYAACIHSFSSPCSFPLFLLLLSWLQIIQKPSTTMTAEFPTAAIGNMLVHVSYMCEHNRPHLWATQKKSARGDGRTLSFNDKPSGAASLKVYSECWCILPTVKMLTKWCLDASRIAVSVFVEAPGQTVRISLDNQDHDVTPVDSQQPAWTSDSLDPKVPHDLQVNKQNPPGQFLELDSIIVTYYDPPTATTEQVAATVAQSIGSVASPAAVFPSSQSMSGASSFGPLPSGSSPEYTAPFVIR